MAELISIVYHEGWSGFYNVNMPAVSLVVKSLSVCIGCRPFVKRKPNFRNTTLFSILHETYKYRYGDMFAVCVPERVISHTGVPLYTKQMAMSLDMFNMVKDREKLPAQVRNQRYLNLITRRVFSRSSVLSSVFSRPNSICGEL